MNPIELQNPTSEINKLLDKFMYIFRALFMDVYRGIYPEDGDNIIPEKFYATLVTIVSNVLTDIAYAQKEDPVYLIRCFNEYWTSAYKSLVRELTARQHKLN